MTVISYNDEVVKWIFAVWLILFVPYMCLITFYYWKNRDRNPIKGRLPGTQVVIDIFFISYSVFIAAAGK